MLTEPVTPRLSSPAVPASTAARAGQGCTSLQTEIEVA